MIARHPEVFVDDKRDLFATEESVCFVSLLLLLVDPLREVRIWDDHLQCSGNPHMERLEVRTKCPQNRSRRLKIVH